MHSLRANAVTVLGNHDLSLLAIADRREADQRKVNPDLQRVLFAPDRDELLDWLRVQPLVHADSDLGWMMVHAGLAPKWTADDALAMSAEVERVLQGRNRTGLLRNMYGDRPAWSSGLRGTDRLRAIINVFTRMRYCSPRGRIAFEEKGAPGTQQPGLYPWYAVPGRVERGLKLACGHWSSLGLFIGHGVHALDTGAVWGGKLTALQIDSEELRIVQVPGREVPATPPQPRKQRS